METKPRHSAARITPEELVAILRGIGSNAITLDVVRADIEAGLPTNEDGTINVEKYAAWLNVQRLKNR